MSLPQKKSSIAINLSLRFMSIMTIATIFLSLAIVFFLNRFSISEKNKDLMQITNAVCEEFKITGTGILRTEIPYYISCTIFDQQTGEKIYSNDPFIPLLQITKKHSLRYYEKDYYVDQSLNILYFSKKIDVNEKSFVVQLSMDLERDENYRLLLLLPRTIVVILIPLLLISFLFCLMMTKEIIKPVEKMTKSAQKISSANFEEQLPVSEKNNELDRLAFTFNSLFKRLKDDFQRERSFTGNVSHELKTPIAIILGEARLLKRWGKDDRNQLEDSLNTIIEEGQIMEEITRNLLQLTKLDGGQIELHKKQISLMDMFNKIDSEFSAINSGLIFNKYVSENDYIESDEALIHQILVAIVSNSIKFAGKNCEIILKAADCGKSIIIEDNGPGFPENSIPHIFDRFYRGDESHSKRSEGSGLGLSIVKSIATTLSLSVVAENIKSNDSQIHGARLIIRSMSLI